MTVISAIGRIRHCKFETSLGYMGREGKGVCVCVCVCVCLKIVILGNRIKCDLGKKVFK
jgi:hypothetical protein